MRLSNVVRYIDASRLTAVSNKASGRKLTAVTWADLDGIVGVVCAFTRCVGGTSTLIAISCKSASSSPICDPNRDVITVGVKTHLFSFLTSRFPHLPLTRRYSSE
jgi:hypothetical protein